MGVGGHQASSPLVTPTRRHSMTSKGGLLPPPLQARFIPVKFEPRDYEDYTPHSPVCPSTTTPIPIKMERMDEGWVEGSSFRATSLPNEIGYGVSSVPSSFSGAYSSSFPSYFSQRDIPPPTVYEYHPVEPAPLASATPFEHLVPIEPLEFDRLGPPKLQLDIEATLLQADMVGKPFATEAIVLQRA